MAEIIWYLPFTDWLLSLSMMLSSSISAVTKGISSFFLSALENSIVQMYHSFLVHSFTDGHLGCFIGIELGSFNFEA